MTLDPEEIADALGACTCWTCVMERAPDPLPPFYPNRMIVCETCGNKRCPRAKDHRHACTNSNEPGQPGSSYENQEKPS